MLIKRAILERIASGDVDLAFRRWTRPTVKTGGRLRTALGDLAIREVCAVSPDTISVEDARRAGYASLADLRSDVSQRPAGDVFRIGLTYVGTDLRAVLADDDQLSDAACKAILDRLNRKGAWSSISGLSLRILCWIDQNPGRRAQDLSDELLVEKPKLKSHIRKLKDVGLTESLQTGYRLSSRGRRVLDYATGAGPR